MGKVCVICGKPTGMFIFCREHQKEKEDGKIIKCEECGSWHYVHELCKICKPINIVKNNISDKKAQTVISDLTCIICGKESSGKHFCRTCYAKYKDRSVDLRITHCCETSILDDYGNLQYKCTDGRKVRSRAEVMISDFLFHNKVRAVYEETIFYKENGEDKKLHPDFYLPDYQLFIEYNEITTKSYKQSKDYTQKIYEQLGKKVIIMTDKDIMDIAAFLKPKLELN